MFVKISQAFDFVVVLFTFPFKTENIYANIIVK